MPPVPESDPFPHALSAPTAPEDPPFDPDRDKREVKKQTRRALFLLLSAIFALFLTFVGILLFYDVPMPDDSALWIGNEEINPPPVTAADADNPLAELVNVLKQAACDDLYLLDSKVRNLEPGTEEEARKFLAGKVPAFAAVDHLIHRTNVGDWRWPELGNEPAANWPRTSAGSVPAMSNLIRLQSRLELADGDWEKSLRSLTDLIQFGDALQRCPGTLFHHLVGRSAQRMGESGLEAALTFKPVPADVLATLQEQIASLEPDRALYERTLRIEYRYFKETLPLQARTADLGSHLGTRFLKPLAPLLTKPGMSCTVRFHEDQAVIQSLRQGWKEGLHQQTLLTGKFEVLMRSQARRLLSVNPVGDCHHLDHTISARSFLLRNLHDLARHRQILLQLALRRCELERGSLPADLADLVPEFLPTVPLDPFTDLPVKWLPSKQLLYSAGADFTDNGGNVSHPASRTDSDVGMYYWWGPAAAKWREEERIKALPSPPSTKKKAPKSKPTQPAKPATT